jgi:8-oxo-dGTP pyrophosphatase MutT (NUDIX family)
VPRVTGRRQLRQHSAGGIVVHEGLVLLIATAQGERWQLPKGRIEPGESPRQTAEREIREETGIVCRAAEALGEIEYEFTAGDGRAIHKRVTYFSCSYLGGSVRDYAREEVWIAAWLPAPVAVARLTFDNERRLLRRTLRRMAELDSAELRDAGDPRGPQPLS